MHYMYEFEDDYISKTKSVKNKDNKRLTLEERKKLEDELITSSVDNKTIFGYASKPDKDIIYCKYNKNNQYFVMYMLKNGCKKVIKSYVKSWQQYTGDKAVNYFDEIPT